MFKLSAKSRQCKCTLKVRSHTRCGSSDFTERCDFSRNSPIFSNHHCWRQRQHVMFSRLCKHHLKVDLHVRFCITFPPLENKKTVFCIKVHLHVIYTTLKIVLSQSLINNIFFFVFNTRSYLHHTANTTSINPIFVTQDSSHRQQTHFYGPDQCLERVTKLLVDFSLIGLSLIMIF